MHEVIKKAVTLLFKKTGGIGIDKTNDAAYTNIIENISRVDIMDVCQEA